MEENPLDQLKKAIQAYHDSLPGLSDSEPYPSKATIPRETARALCGLGRDELGDLADKLLDGGPDALNGEKIYGLVITVPPVGEDVNEIQVS